MEHCSVCANAELLKLPLNTNACAVIRNILSSRTCLHGVRYKYIYVTIYMYEALAICVHIFGNWVLVHNELSSDKESILPSA
jgi:hypothetical protein